MIDVRDLMVGNYVINENSIFQLRLTDDYELVWHFVGSKDFHFTAKQAKGKMKPIPITPEWLKRLEFTHDIDNLWSYKDFSIFPFLIGKNGDCCSFFISYARAEEGRVWLVDCHYVHQLQNLIYSLTGQELSIGGGV